MKISDDLKIYASYSRVAEAHLALVEEIRCKNSVYYNSIRDKMQKWMYNILDTFETEILRKEKFHYLQLIRVLRERVKNGFKRINSLEVIVK